MVVIFTYKVSTVKIIVSGFILFLMYLKLFTTLTTSMNHTLLLKGEHIADIQQMISQDLGIWKKEIKNF